jgi:hypothetical protein
MWTNEYMHSADTRRWVQLGADQGATWGFLLALAYALWILWEGIRSIVATNIIQQMSNGSTPTFFHFLQIENVLMLLFIIPATLLVGGMMGGIPAIVIGAVSGMILGGVLSHHAIRPSPKARFLASAGVGVVGALLVNIIGSRILLDTWDYGNPYPPLFHGLFIGLPSIVYIIVCLILSQRIPLLVEHAHTKETPVNAPILPS